MLKKYIVLFVLVSVTLISAYFILGKQDERALTNEQMDEPMVVSLQQQKENLVAFTRIYGYIRYFHPSTEAEGIDWERFAVYGVKYVREARDTEELKQKLEELFLPIAPTIQIVEQRESFQDPFESYTVTNGSTYVAWQHVGHANYNEYDVNEFYKKKKVKFSKDLYTKKLFQVLPNVNDTTEVSINQSLKTSIPLVLPTDFANTYGATEQTKQLLQQLKRNLSEGKDKVLDGSELATRIAGVVVFWNAIQHFYPFYEQMDEPWLDVLPIFVEEALESNNSDDYHELLLNMVKKTKDGATNLNVMVDKYRYSTKQLPFQVSVIKDKLVITKTLPDSQFNKGDIITEINGVKAKEYLATLMNNFAGSEQLKKTLALEELHYSESRETVNLVVQRGKESKQMEAIYLKDYLEINDEKNVNLQKVVEVEDNIFYVNALLIREDQFVPYMDKLKRAKGIIFDFRGAYSSGISTVLPYLLTSPEKVSVPSVERIIYPDRKTKAGLQSVEMWEFRQKEVSFHPNMVFLSNGKSIGIIESVLDTLQSSGQGIVVGERTGGFGGIVAEINIPGHKSILFTNTIRKKEDGALLHLEGVVPDFYVEQSLESVKVGRDDYIEKAIEILKSR